MAPVLTENAVRVLEARYLRRDPDGELVESPDGLFRRVAAAVAKAEQESFGGSEADAGGWEEAFFHSLAALEFLPNSPTLMNAGTPLGQLSACFVLPVEDSMGGIFESLKLMALIQQSGGGTGFSFSKLRPRGDRVQTTGGEASGPVSFMRIFDCATDNIRQGGRRRGANMAILSVDHPDILEFIDAKRDGSSFRNFNLSVGVSDAFMRAAAADTAFRPRHPVTGKEGPPAPASELFRRIVEAAWGTGDPGLVFLDAVNRANPTPELGRIEATNPCGEVPLLPYEACNLGSINLSRMVRVAPGGSGEPRHELDWEKLRSTTRLAVRFLDNVVEAGRRPDPRIEETVRANRKVGLGVMGFAEMLILLGVPYAGESAAALAEEIIECMREESHAASMELARERGVFPNFEKSVHAERGHRLRNATLLSIAPTGTISIIAGTSSGIEPLFALAYRRSHVLGDDTLLELNPLFLAHARAQGVYSEEIVEHLCRQGSLAKCPGIGEDTARLFQTALEIAPEGHLRIQAAFQRHVDNAVSKTINLPQAATADDVAAVYRSAWELELKGITIYRYGSKSEQVLELGTGEAPEEHEHFSHCDPHSCRL